MATLSEIAEKTGVSIATVSRILNHDDKLVVSESVRLSVFKVAHEFGYQTPRQKKTKRDKFLIAIADWHIIPPGESFDYTLSSIASAYNPNENIVITRLGKNEVKQVDGIIALGSFSEEEKNNLLLSSLNILFINSNKDLDYTFNRIIIDFDIALKKSIDYLISSNCTRIAFIGGISTYDGITIGENRTRRIKELLKEKNVFSEELFLCKELDGENGKSLMIKALENNADGIIISNQAFEESALKEFEASNSNAKIILYRDIEKVDDTISYPAIRMYPPRIWKSAIHILQEVAQKPDNSMNIYIPAEFDTQIYTK